MPDIFNLSTSNVTLYDESAQRVGTPSNPLLVSSGASFSGLLKFEPAPGQELRADESLADRYHGAAPDNSDEASPVWAVVRFYKNPLGQIVRVRYRTGLRWTERTLGW